MTAFDASKLWGGAVIYNQTAGPELISSIVDFVGNVENDQASSSIVFWSRLPALQDTVVIAAYEDTDGVVAGPSF